MLVVLEHADILNENEQRSYCRARRKLGFSLGETAELKLPQGRKLKLADQGNANLFIFRWRRLTSEASSEPPPPPAALKCRGGSADYSGAASGHFSRGTAKAVKAAHCSSDVHPREGKEEQVIRHPSRMSS